MHFKKASIDNLKEMKFYLKKAENRGCTFCAGNIIAWGQDLPLTYGIVEDTLVFKRVEENEVIYHISAYNDRFPMIVESLVRDASSLEKDVVFADLSAEMKETLEEMAPDVFSWEYDRDGSDYVYEVSALANLSGKRYHKKKNHVNRFKKLYDFTYEEITDENKAECLKMLDEWMAEKEWNPSLAAEREAIEAAFRYYKELEYKGGLIRMDGKVMAFTMGEEASKDTFVTHFEKALDTISQLYAVINQQFALHQLSTYKYVNREEDLGIEGLRKAKTSYHPVFMVDKYRAGLKVCDMEECIGLWEDRKLCRTA